MSDYTTYTTENPSATEETALVDGEKFRVLTDDDTKTLFNFDTGAKFVDYNLDGGIFNGTSAENDASFINNESIWTNSVGLTDNTVKNNTQEKSQKEKSGYTVVGVTKERKGTLWSENAFSTKSRTLVYPEDHAAEEYDFIKITPIEYVPALGSDNFGANSSKDMSQYSTADMSSSEWFGFESIKSRYQRVKRVGSTMFLPMVPDIQEGNSVNWGENTMNALQAAGGAAAFKAIGTAGGGKPIKAMSDMIGQGGDIAKAFVNTPGMGDFIKAYFAGKAVGTNLLGRSGIALNPNLEVLFNGPLLRTFQYSFRFTPRSDSEAQTVRTIIKVFKKTMAPKRRNKVFLDVPAVYKIKYVYNSERKDHPFLNKIKPCALANFNVQYAPDGNYMTYDDGSMTSYGVSLTFKELEPIYNDDIRDVDATTTGF